VTNDIEILKRLKRIEADLLNINLLIGKLTNMLCEMVKGPALANNSRSVGKQLVEDVICPGPFPEGVCGQCEYPKNKCICNYTLCGDREPHSG
jgi:hypothetical protein